MEGTNFGQHRLGHPDLTDFGQSNFGQSIFEQSILGVCHGVGAQFRSSTKNVAGEGKKRATFLAEGGPTEGFRQRVVQTNNHTTNTNHNNK